MLKISGCAPKKPPRGRRSLCRACVSSLRGAYAWRYYIIIEEKIHLNFVLIVIFIFKSLKGIKGSSFPLEKAAFRALSGFKRNACKTAASNGQRSLYLLGELIG